MNSHRLLCVFCGSRPGANPEYAESARQIGRSLVSHGLGLVYGGGRVGLMGVVADSVLEAGGHVLGVIPKAMAGREIAHHGVSELVVVPNMHARKALMADRACGFLMLPGGVGTFEEFFEILTWSVLGIHRKPIGILSTAGYYQPLLSLIQHSASEGFLDVAHLARLTVSDDPDEVVRHLAACTPLPAPHGGLTLEES
ncbi:MAG TPA: TIGR00730 family Rossman fold protein [Isosphaeraceae bacterium]|nr:TIGR00730 family Rossman fold protein [Isosphaeraceae bacterium]